MLSWYWQRRKNKESKGKIRKKSNKEQIAVGHLPDALAEILTPLMKTWKIYSTKAIISEHHRAAPEGKWIPGRGINWQKLFEPKIHLNVLARKYKTFNVNHFPLL